MCIRDRLTIFRRRNIRFVFQNYNLVPILNVYENIVLPIELDGNTIDTDFVSEIEMCIRDRRHTAHGDNQQKDRCRQKVSSCVSEQVLKRIF